MQRIHSSAGSFLKSLTHSFFDLTSERILFGAALLASCVFVFLFFWVAIQRVDYPFDLEWMEGGMLTHSQRLLQGKPVFGPPSVDFIPYIYQPLYAIVLALLANIWNLTPQLGRTLSIVSTMIVSVLLFRTVHRETGSLSIALVSIGLFFALYSVTGFWFDLVRVDAMFLMWIMAALYLASHHTQLAGRWFVVALLMTAAYFTKQTAVLFIPIAFPLLYRQTPGSAFGYAITVLLLIVGITICTDLSTDGWYSYYVYTIVSDQPQIWQRIHKDFWLKAAGDLPVVLSTAAAYGVWRLARLPLREGSQEVWLLATGAGMISGVMSYSWWGGFDNNFIPFYVFSIIPACKALHAGWNSTSRVIPLTAAIALLVQQYVLIYNPVDQIPTDEETQGANKILELLAGVPGPVLIPEHPWYAVLAGKKPSYQTMALVDLRHRQKNSWPEDLRSRLQSGYYSLVVVSWDPGRPSLGSYPPELLKRYRKTDVLKFSGRTLGSYVGTWAKPSILYKPANASSSSEH